ncbi:MAG: hypothetical protein ACQEWG_12725 [Bacteroidota bacterium]
MTETAKDSLLQFNSYTIPGDDTLEIMEVAITEKSEEFMQLTYSFTTGQRAFVIIQIRVFQKRDGKPLIVYAKFGGLPRAFDQHILKIFDFSAGSLIETQKKLLPETIGVKEFLEPKDVDNFASDLEVMSTSYELNPEEKNSLIYKLEPQIYGKGEIENLIKTYDFVYKWNGEVFIKKQK